MIPDVPPQRLLNAMKHFDSSMRGSDLWNDWEQKAAYEFGIEQDGLLYPPRQVVFLATGADLNKLENSLLHQYIASKGLKVVPLVKRDPQPVVTAVKTKTVRAKAVKKAPVASASSTIRRWFTPTALERLIPVFQKKYASFNEADYIRDERNYKLVAGQLMRDLLAKDILGQLIEEKKFEEGAARIRKAAHKSKENPDNNLLNQWDMMHITVVPQDELVTRLYRLLYAEGSFALRLAAWIELMGQQKPNCWPTATYFLMLQDPARYIFVKPEPFSEFLNSVGSDLPWHTQPTPEYYAQLLQLGQALLPKLAPLGAKDMVDVQSFIWIVSSAQNPTEEEQA